jgi:hypothetical protein
MDQDDPTPDDFDTPGKTADLLLGSDQGKWLNQLQKHRYFGGEIGLKRGIWGSKMGSQAMGHGFGTVRDPALY